MSGAAWPRIIRAVSPLVPVLAGLLALALGVFLRTSLGGRYRVGLLLTAAPRVSVAEAVALADGPARYVQVSGRIDSETDFEDEAHRPLVYRRTRLQVRDGARWTDLDDRRERVPFDIREGLDAIGVDDGSLDLGLVVVVRESEGTAADVPERVPAGTDPAAPVRLRVEQVSSVEHAIVAGVPRPGDDGRAVLTAGLGRPLILATMDRADALRILAAGRPWQPVVIAACLLGGSALVVVGLAWALVAGAA
jgi:hypothetical protein